MRTYEAACVFRAEEELFNAAKEEVLAVLKDLGADSIKEHDMGVRNLTHPIKDELQAHYLVFEFTMDPEKIQQIGDRVKYFNNLLRILVTRRDN